MRRLTRKHNSNRITRDTRSQERADNVGTDKSDLHEELYVQISRAEALSMHTVMLAEQKRLEVERKSGRDDSDGKKGNTTDE